MVDSDAKARARAMVNIQSFFLAPYIWRTVWEETTPKKPGPTTLTDKHGLLRTIHQEKFEITTGKYGLIRLMALWYILTEIYLGNYPTQPTIVSMIAHRIGNENTAKRVLSTILPSVLENTRKDGRRVFICEMRKCIGDDISDEKLNELLSNFVETTRGWKDETKKIEEKGKEKLEEIVNKDFGGDIAAKLHEFPLAAVREIMQEDFGWFVLRTAKQLKAVGDAGDKEPDDQTGCICWANEKVRKNIFAMVKTVIEVGKKARDDTFFSEFEEKIIAVYSMKMKTSKEHEAISRLLNSPNEFSLTSELCKEVRRCLNKFGFRGDDGSEEMKIDEQKTEFKELYDAITISETKIKKSPKIPNFEITWWNGVIPSES